MRPLSLRARLTLAALLIITLIAAALTLTSMLGARQAFLPPAASVGQYSAGVTESASSLSDAAYSGAIAGTEEGAAAYSEVTYNASAEEAATAFNRFSLLAMAILIGLGGIITYFAVGHGLRPVRRLREAIGGISESELSARVKAVGTGDEIDGLIGAFNLLLARMEKAFADREGFAAAAAHELKTPLAALLATLDVLEMDAAPSREEYENLARVARAQTGRMTRLVDDLLALSMGEAYGFTDLISAEQLLSEIVDGLRHAIEAKALDVSVHAQACRALPCNAAMLRRALLNIIDNAVKYTQEGGRVDITAVESERSFLITVADTGPGIPEESRARVFEPFYRVDKSRSRRMGGAGLGLAIAKDLVEKHGGRISVWDNGGQGSVFSVELPKAARDSEL